MRRASYSWQFPRLLSSYFRIWIDMSYRRHQGSILVSKTSSFAILISLFCDIEGEEDGSLLKHLLQHVKQVFTAEKLRKPSKGFALGAWNWTWALCEDNQDWKRLWPSNLDFNFFLTMRNADRKVHLQVPPPTLSDNQTQISRYSWTSAPANFCVIKTSRLMLRPTSSRNPCVNFQRENNLSTSPKGSVWPGVCAQVVGSRKKVLWWIRGSVEDSISRHRYLRLLVWTFFLSFNQKVWSERDPRLALNWALIITFS